MIIGDVAHLGRKTVLKGKKNLEKNYSLGEILEIKNICSSMNQRNNYSKKQLRKKTLVSDYIAIKFKEDGRMQMRRQGQLGIRFAEVAFQEKTNPQNTLSLPERVKIMENASTKFLHNKIKKQKKAVNDSLNSPAFGAATATLSICKLNQIGALLLSFLG